MNSDLALPEGGFRRIVSLLPSATEILCGLGLRERLVAVSHECDYPADVRSLPKVTRTHISAEASSAEIDRQVREQLQTEKSLYSLDVHALQDLQPDLIVTQVLCDVCAVAESEVRTAVDSLAVRPEIIQLEPQRLEDVLQCIAQVGNATNRAEQTAVYLDTLRRRIAAVSQRSALISARPRVVLLEWLDPPFSAGHWNPELIHLAGGQECLGGPGQRSMSVTWQQVADANPDVLLIACCGMDLAKSQHELKSIPQLSPWRTLRCVRSGRVHLVDGSQYFNRPGPRLVDSLEILANILHPEIHPPPAGHPLAITIPAQTGFV